MIKIRIDLNAGIIEAEGEESFVKEVYKDFKDGLFTTKKHEVQEVPESIKTVAAKFKKTSNEVSKKNKSKNTGALPAVNKELIQDLGQKDKDLRSFLKLRKLTSAFEKNVTFVYILEKELGRDKINVDDIYTCYKYFSVKPPEAFRQSVLDTGSKKYWINTTSMDNIKLTGKGLNVAEYELIIKVEE